MNVYNGFLLPYGYLRTNGTKKKILKTSNQHVVWMEFFKGMGQQSAIQSHEQNVYLAPSCGGMGQSGVQWK